MQIQRTWKHDIPVVHGTVVAMAALVAGVSEACHQSQWSLCKAGAVEHVAQLLRLYREDAATVQLLLTFLFAVSNTNRMAQVDLQLSGGGPPGLVTWLEYVLWARSLSTWLVHVACARGLCTWLVHVVAGSS